MSTDPLPALFTPLQIRGVEFRNRIAVSPMCQYSAEDGMPNDWHLVHLGSRASGGAGLVIVEATAVEARGRITDGDLGIWKDEHIPAYARIVSFLKSQGAVAGIQLAHAGRKASSELPWNGGAHITPADGGWQTVGPSPLGFKATDNPPHELSREEIKDTVQRFVDAARRALAAGFQVAEIHAAHGYLIHEFLSPLSNQRTDEYGGSFDNRTRLLLEIAQAVRAVWPEELPLFVRLSVTDWKEGGWTEDESVAVSARLKSLGVDFIDCSSGGLAPDVRIPVKPGYQTGFAAHIRRYTGILTGAVGMITEPEQANHIITSGQADMVLLARELLRDPYWPLHAAKRFGIPPKTPVQYDRAF